MIHPVYCYKRSQGFSLKRQEEFFAFQAAAKICETVRLPLHGIHVHTAIKRYTLCLFRNQWQTLQFHWFTGVRDLTINRTLCEL